MSGRVRNVGRWVAAFAGVAWGFLRQIDGRDVALWGGWALIVFGVERAWGHGALAGGALAFLVGVFGIHPSAASRAAEGRTTSSGAA